ncbi:MAG: hypothetical protein ABFD50_00380 [Smithella sp.]
MSMKGGIYSRQRCPVCGGMFQDNHVNALTCPAHPDVKATKFYIKFGNVYNRFRDYNRAFRHLTGLRFKTDEKTFDERDYKKDNPLGFIKMSEKWMDYHLPEVRPGSQKNIKNHIRYAQNYFQNRNVKDIKCGDLEDFIRTINLSGKSKHNIMSTLHDFYAWMKRRQEIIVMPEFPVIKYELGYRRTIDKETQQAIIEEIKRICPNPKVYLGVKWLATYFSVRPAEMISLTEGNIDLANGYFYFPHPKEKKYKSVPIIPEDIEILESIALTFPAMPFFRHSAGLQSVTENEPFGEKYFYKWWIKACQNLKIEGVDLYGGTRHSTVRALRKYRTPEELKRAAMSATNKAFDRYFGLEEDENLRSIYTQSAQVVRFEPATKVLLKKGVNKK